MNEEELKRLIEKYYKGESTEEEENILREYFRNNIVPEEYKTEKQIFSYYSESAAIPEPSPDFEMRIMEGIDASERIPGSQRIKRYFLPLLRAAAVLIILVGSYFFFIYRTKQYDTFSDPEIAYAETIKILRSVSMEINQGARELEPVGKINEIKKKSFNTMNKPALIVEKNMKNLDYLKKAIEITHPSSEKKTNK